MTDTQQDLSSLRAPYHISLASTMTLPAQQSAAALLHHLSAENIASVQLANNNTTESAAITDASVLIKNMVDGRGLACPMPLLKTKVALRTINHGESLYVVATDPNSQADILAFCQHTQQSDTQALTLILNEVTHSMVDNQMDTPKTDTIFHFIITKTDTK